MRNEATEPSAAVCTVAIPVYNRQELVVRALESALSQTVEGLEVLVVDNCSTDDTWKVLQAHAADPRLTLVRNESNLGLFGNFNRCLALARGKYLRFLCSDDRLAPDCLRDEVATLERHPDAGMLATRARHVDEQGRLVRIFAGELPPGIYDGRQAIYDAFWLQVYYGKNPLNCPSGILIRRSAARQVGEWDAGMRMAGDVEYYCRLMRHGNLAVVDRVGCDMLLHNEQESASRGYTATAIQEYHRMIEDNADILDQYGSVRRIERQTISWLYWQQLQAWSVGGRTDPGFGEQRRRSPGYHPARALWGLAEVAVRRAWIKFTGKYPVPFGPIRPLEDAPRAPA